MARPTVATPEFVAEAQEIVDALNRDLIAAEVEGRAGEVPPQRINSLFRSAHSLKGISGMFGLDLVSGLAHEMESVLDGMRLGKVRLDAKALDVLFACVERFGVLIAAAGGNGGEAAQPTEQDIAGLVTQLKQVTAGGTPSGADELSSLVQLKDEVLGVLTEYEEHRLRDNLAHGRKLYMLQTTFELSSFDVGLAEIDAAVSKIGEVITKLPSSKTGEPGTLAFDIMIGTDASEKAVVAALGDEKITVVPIARSGGGKAPEAAAEPVGAAAAGDGGEAAAHDETAALKSVSRTVRVDIRRLDRLMNLVGELGLTKMALERIGVEIRRKQGFTELAADLHKENRNFERRLAELQAGIMEVRMVPMAGLFERMVRIGRKMGRELGREIRIEVTGEATELDKLIVEDLADPLMHLIRNAIDHGIESPDERKSAGKDPEGTVRLTAAARGNHVVVEVSDDGRGIDIAKTLEAAVARGLVAAERAPELSRREIFGLLFLPGFSTRTEVSEYSGRGVGLDVVKTKIADLYGVIDVESKPREGTRVTVTLPITLAIIPALVVNVAGRTYAVPLNNVQETLAVDRAAVRTIERREVISVRGATVPITDLRSVFQLAGKGRPEVSFAVIVGVGHSRLALVVDELVGQQDIVIKSLGRRLRGVPGIAGAAELGNQQTILVIDVVQIFNELSVGRDEIEGGA
ncbi:MAG: chemotaxis protein CheA [Deltaproteobacteria bacterium]|nr:chemotaxis protein CheA [Deltaproteobacteria bacterium]